MQATREVLHKHNNLTGWLIFVAAIWVFLPSILMKHVWIDVERVHVSDAPVGQSPLVTAHRKIHRDFLGSFSVTVRRQNGTVACLPVESSGFTYRAKASTVNPLEMPLSSWIGPVMPRDCAARLDSGFYKINTCHTVYFPHQIPIARRCVASNYFEVYDEAKL